MKVVISGSFRKHLEDIKKLKVQLESKGIEVIKLDNIEVISNEDNPEFVKFTGQENKTEEELQLEYDIAIENCDAHIICNIDGYIGSSALRELFIGAGNNTITTKMKNNGQVSKRYSQVYLLEPPSKEALGEHVYNLIMALVQKGNVRIGLTSIYRIVEQEKGEER